MRTPISEVIEHSDVQRFVAVAKEFCTVVESVSSLPKADFLERLDELLPALYSLAHRLPEPFDWSVDDDDDDEPVPVGIPYNAHHDCWREWCDRIGKKLEPHRWFHFVYDPVNPDDKEIIDADLADIVADVYLGVKDGLILFARSSDIDKAAAIWRWRAGVDSIWGRVLSEAILPVHSLIHEHYDEDDEVFDI